MGKLTGGDWEARANEYWDRWHQSARIAYEEQMRAETAERERDRYREALEHILRMTDLDVSSSRREVSRGAISAVAREALRP